MTKIETSLNEPRDATLDILRAVGLLLIILAHCNPPGWLFQFRNFDVPLMVVVSAATFASIYHQKSISILNFYKKRLSKLILPAWYFLTFFFVTLLLYFKITSQPYPFSNKEILSSYLFYSGIGYVWILRIFIMIAILTPPILYFKRQVTSPWIYAIILMSIYVIYEGILSGMNFIQLPENYKNVLNTVIFPILPFSILYAYGVHITNISVKWLALLAVIFLSIFLCLAIPLYIENGHFIQTQTAKYPPTIYYLSYSLFMINVIILILRTKIILYIPKYPCTWLSMNSLWIYLWHIYGLYIWDNTLFPPENDLLKTAYKFIFVLSFGTLMTAFQNIIQKNLIKKIKAQLSKLTVYK